MIILLTTLTFCFLFYYRLAVEISLTKKEKKQSKKKRKGEHGNGIDSSSGPLKDPYYCPMCILDYERFFPRRDRSKRFAARQLPHCHMSRYIERMVTYRIHKDVRREQVRAQEVSHYIFFFF